MATRLVGVNEEDPEYRIMEGDVSLRRPLKGAGKR